MKFFLVIIHILLLVCGYSVFLNQWITPQAFPYLNLIPLTFPIIFAVNLTLVIFWWIYRWKIGLIFTLLSIGLLFPINRTFHLFGSPETDQSNLKILSYNVHYFYDNPDGIHDILEQEKPHIFFMQELGPDHETFLNTLTYTEKMFYADGGSLLTASIYPIVESNYYRTPPHSTTLSYADIALPEDTIRFVNFYLESLHIDQQKVKNAEINSELKFLAKDLTSKLIQASRVHQICLDSLLPKVLNTKHPVIIAGDMNSVPNTYEYYMLKNGRKDPFLKGGSGLGSTFPSFGYPIRLDYIFIPPEFKTKSYRILDVPYSDHYPVVVEIDMP